MAGEAFVSISWHLYLHDLRSSLACSQFLCVFFSLPHQLVWELQQYENEDLQHHALAAAAQDNAVCSKNVSIFHLDFLCVGRKEQEEEEGDQWKSYLDKGISFLACWKGIIMCEAMKMANSEAINKL